MVGFAVALFVVAVAEFGAVVVSLGSLRELDRQLLVVAGPLVEILLCALQNTAP